MTRTSVWHQGASIYVLGTDDFHVACRAAGISAETHRWAGTVSGYYARRRNGWTYKDPGVVKDSRIGVHFIGPIIKEDINETY